MNTRKTTVFFRGSLVLLLLAAFGTAALNGNATTAAAARSGERMASAPTDDGDNGDDADGAGKGDRQNGDGNGEGITAEDFTEAFPIYTPSLDADLFVDCVDNPYFPLIPGTVYHLEEQTDEGVETVTVTVTNETKEILGIQVTVVHDVVEVEGEVTEDTFDWFAQDDRGNVWYLGEDTREMEGGKVVSTEGSWEAGVDGAVAGIIMLGDPRPGDIYYQEFFKGEAEDQGGIISLSEQVTVPFGSFEDVLQTADYNPLDDELENKWYAPGVGVVKEIVVGEDGSVELIDVTHDKSMMDPSEACGP